MREMCVTVTQCLGQNFSVNFMTVICVFIFASWTLSSMFCGTLHVWKSFAGDGKCVICDSYVRPNTLVRVCDECNYGSYAGRCVICGGMGVSDAYYCKECTIQEKDVSHC